MYRRKPFPELFSRRLFIKRGIDNRGLELSYFFKIDMAVSSGVFVQIFLVILLGRNKFFYRPLLNGYPYPVALLQIGKRHLYNRGVVRIGIIYARTVLLAYISSLTVDGRRVYGIKIFSQYVIQTCFIVIIYDLHRLAESRGLGTHLLIGDFFSPAVGVAAFRRYNAIDFAVHIFLQTPEASARKVDFSFHNSASLIPGFYYISGGSSTRAGSKNVAKGT